MGIGEDEKILRQIAVLEDEHRALDMRITNEAATIDQLNRQRLKKRKLWLKDEIARLYDYLEPDIIA